MVSKLDIGLQGSPLNIVRQCGPHLSDILDSKFGCVATFKGVDFESGSSFAQWKRPTVAPEKRFSVKLPAGVTVSVWKADLTNFPVDAVVNAANSSLQHGGGLAQALCEVGGPQIQHESDIHTNTYGPVSTGDAVVTNAGNLPCQKIIHAVGPHLPYNFTQFDVSAAKPQLEKAVVSILERVKENHLNTVAIPAISSGLFRYPLPECARTIVSTVKQYYERYSSRGHLPEEIFFMNHDEPTVKEMERACHQILAPYQSYQFYQSMPYSQAAGSNTRGATKMSKLSVRIGDVRLTLKSDNIEDQRTDVIVNTASSDRDLKKGQISFALFNKAGSKMQSEIYNAPLRNSVIITQAYGLWCKEVYHTFCVAKRENAAHKILSDSVSECLLMAAQKHHKSIAFPAIGTGNLGFTAQEVACIMSGAVIDFSKKFTGKMDVYFVIFPSDYITFQAFEDKMSSLQQKESQSSITPALKDKEDFSFSSTLAPHISLSGPSEESVSEAKKWLTQHLVRSSPCVTVYNNFIQHFSEKDYMQLSRLAKQGVQFEEFLANGHACLTVNGGSVENVAVASLQVEAMLCTIQKEFVTEEENEMRMMLTNDMLLGRDRKTKRVDCSSPEFSVILSAFKNKGLWLLKVDKVENPALEMLFDLKKKQLGDSTPQKMFQRIPAQFCEMVSRIGFHAECAPPEDPKYGEGIYFAGTVKKAMEVWKEKNDEYLYFVEAEVLTGKSTHGKPGLILPPATGTDPTVRFGSVSGGPGISVIFSGYQALPKYIITCKKM